MGIIRRLKFILFGKRKRGFTSPREAVNSLMQTYIEQATGRVSKHRVPRQMDVPFKDIKHAKASLSVVFGSATGTATFLPGKGEGKAGFKNIIGGLDMLTGILGSKKRLNPILRQAFTATVLLELRSRIIRAGPLHTQTRARAGSGGSTRGRASSNSEIKKRTAEFKEGAKTIHDMLTNSSKLIVRNGFVGLASLNEFTNIEVGSSPSKLNSIFLMLEFGTGRFAKPSSLIRTKGRYKVPSAVATLHRDVRTSDWFNLGWVADLSRKFTKEAKNPDKKRIRAFDFKWAANKGRLGRHIIFQERGIAASLVKAKRKALQEVINIINNRIDADFPGWGKVTLRKINIPNAATVTLTI